MKTCAFCGWENEDQSTKCLECGADLVQGPAPTKHSLKEPGETDRFEKVAVLDNEVQAELIDGVLSGRDIPHIMQSYHDSALDGLFQGGKGWGVILAPASFREEILTALADIRRQSQSSPGGSEGDDT